MPNLHRNAEMHIKIRYILKINNFLQKYATAKLIVVMLDGITTFHTFPPFIHFQFYTKNIAINLHNQTNKIPQFMLVNTNNTGYKDDNNNNKILLQAIELVKYFF